MRVSRAHKINRNLHFKRRMAERYGITINKHDRREIQNILSSYSFRGSLLYLGEKNGGKIVALYYRDKFVIVVYDKKRNQVITALTEDMITEEQKRRLNNLKVRVNYMNENKLEVLKCCVEYLNETNKSLEKKKRFIDLYNSGSIDVELWRLIYNFDVLFHITSSRVKDNYVDSNYDTQFNTITDLLKALSNGLTGNKALKEVSKFIKSNKEYQDLIYDVLDKDLHIGLSVTTMNELVPGLFKDFQVALAKPIKNEELDSNWVIEHKLDGVRCLCVINSVDDIQFYSRKGKDFTTLGKLKGTIKCLIKEGKCPTNVVLDGEVCSIDENGNEDFKSIMKEIKRKDYTMNNPMYILFDIIPLDDFNSGYSKQTYKDRLNRLNSIFGVDKHDCIRMVEFEDYTVDNFKKWKQFVFDKNWEGLILRKDVPYEATRSSNMVKVKEFYDAEYVVKDVEFGGDATIVVDGKAQRIECIKRLIIEHKGNLVGVGSGLSQEQRIDFNKHPEHIIGKTITVRYFEETTDENGNPSLRFPTLKYIYENEREV